MIKKTDFTDNCNFTQNTCSIHAGNHNYAQVPTKCSAACCNNASYQELFDTKKYGFAFQNELQGKDENRRVKKSKGKECEIAMESKVDSQRRIISVVKRIF